MKSTTVFRGLKLRHIYIDTIETYKNHFQPKTLELSGQHGLGGIRWLLKYSWILPLTNLAELK